MEKIEQARLSVQQTLDAQKTQSERNKLGQFATPTPLAVQILEEAKRLLPKSSKVRFLDPAIGTGSFYSALLKTFPRGRIGYAVGYEIDPHYGEHTRILWKDTPLTLHLADFTKAEPPLTDAAKPNLIVCNPPYVRHHHLDGEDKIRLQNLSLESAGVELSGLSGLYCHFLARCHAWMDEGAVAIWLIPSEFMDVNYGRAVKNYLLKKVTLLRIHRFDPSDLQFSDALVSSAVVIFRNEKPESDYGVEFTYGGSLHVPKMSRTLPSFRLAHESKWTKFPSVDIQHAKQNVTRLSDLFSIKRGLATGSNEFFLMAKEDIRKHHIPNSFLTPILPSPRYVEGTVIEADAHGNPELDRQLFLFGSDLSEDEIERRHPSVWAYLEQGKKAGVDKGYLCAHRSLWYQHEIRPAAPIVCTYMGRGNGGSIFHFILNKSRATATNVYLLLYPKPNVARAIKADPTVLIRLWEAMNRIPAEVLIGEGRVYGGGLHKLEPKELANAPLDVSDILSGDDSVVQTGNLFAI